MFYKIEIIVLGNSFPKRVCEGSKGIRGYINKKRFEILEQEKREDELLKQQGRLLRLTT